VKKLLKRLPLLLSAAGLVAALAYGFRPSPVPVDVAEVARGPLLVTVDEEGKTRVSERFVVAAPLAGRMRRVKYKPGADVDGVLVEIDPPPPALLDVRARDEAQARVHGAEAGLKKAGANLARARVNEDAARSEYDRLRGTSSAAPQELETASAKASSAAEDLRAAAFAERMAVFELNQARAALRVLDPAPSADTAVRPFEIPSPIPRGKVLRVMKESETLVTPGTEIMEVGDPETLEVVVDLLTTDAVKVRRKMRALLEHWGGDRPLEAVVRHVEPSGFTKNSALGVEEQRVNVILDFKDPAKTRGIMGDAYRVEARIVVWEGKDVLKVPSGALFRKGGGQAVWVVEGGKAVLRPVKVAHDNGREAEVLGGLKAGERVVVHPGDKVKEGVSVAPRD
jgi:HlyD family secretion protein